MSKSFIIFLLALSLGAANKRGVDYGQTLPSSCSTGDIFIKTNATPGSNIYTCNSTNQWTQQYIPSGDVTGNTTVIRLQGRDIDSVPPQSGQALLWNSLTNKWTPSNISSQSSTGGASQTRQLLDFQVSQSSSTVLTLGASCTATTPCNARLGSIVYTLSAALTITVSSGTGDVYIYISSAGTLTVGHNISLVCATACAAVTGISSFPTDSLPLYTWHATSGTWDSTGTDQRAFLSTKNVSPSSGASTTESGGSTLLGVDSTQVSLKVSAPSNASSTCTTGNWAMDTNFYYLCISSNTWRRASLVTW